ncbi:MAG: peptide chain release factor 1 [Chitinophagales bacterium]|nr:peptide chain release factor 1 [Bacteroidota bacterium]MCB9043018.1 peptide chain release factor 1 [Chitinophagales bacterium]
MLDKLEAIVIRYKDIEQQLSDPALTADLQRFTQLSKEYKDLDPLVKTIEQYKALLAQIEENKQILKTETDNELREMVKVDLEESDERKKNLEEELKILLIPKDPEDSKNAIVEIRAGTGGDEAAIFAGDLFRMYKRYIETKNWQMEILSENESSAGGFKEISFEVSGDNVYGDLKYESGVHRVQRVPETEAKGRVHTSAATVAVLPEAEEVDVQINPADLRIDTYRASGAGGQHVNKTESAIRITHIPTGIVAESQQSRNQHKNREIAMKMLSTRIYEAEYSKHMAEIAQHRKTLVSTGDRSAKIRTYNFPQGRMTDHRIGLTLYNLDAFVNGDIQEVIDALKVAENAEKLKEGGI